MKIRLNWHLPLYRITEILEFRTRNPRIPYTKSANSVKLLFSEFHGIEFRFRRKFDNTEARISGGILYGTDGIPWHPNW